MRPGPTAGLLAALTCMMIPMRAPRAEDAAKLALGYTMYAAGLPVVSLQVQSDITPTGYGLSLGFRAIGLYGALFSSNIITEVQGYWRGDRAAPLQLASHGEWRGTPRDLLIEYQGDQPTIRRMIPPEDPDRIPVPPAQQAHTIDTLSAVALLVHRVALTGRCDGSATTYDGHRLTEISATTFGPEVLAPSSRSGFAGPTLRCDFSGRLIGGLMVGDDPKTEGRPRRGSAWLAAVTPGGPPMPVRMSFETNWFGDAMMYLNDVAPGRQAAR